MTDDEWETLLTLPLNEQVDHMLKHMKTVSDTKAFVNCPVLNAWIRCNKIFISKYLTKDYK